MGLTFIEFYYLQSDCVPDCIPWGKFKQSFKKYYYLLLILGYFDFSDYEKMVALNQKIIVTFRRGVFNNSEFLVSLY